MHRPQLPLGQGTYLQVDLESPNVAVGVSISDDTFVIKLRRPRDCDATAGARLGVNVGLWRDQCECTPLSRCDRNMAGIVQIQVDDFVHIGCNDCRSMPCGNVYFMGICMFFFFLYEVFIAGVVASASLASHTPMSPEVS